MRPRVVCHMMMSIDGRIVVDGWPLLPASGARRTEDGRCAVVAVSSRKRNVEKDRVVVRHYRRRPPYQPYPLHFYSSPPHDVWLSELVPEGTESVINPFA